MRACRIFDPLDLGSGYYTIGRFFDYFDHDVLSVMVPITSNLNIRGYVSIHMDMQDIYRDRGGAAVQLLYAVSAAVPDLFRSSGAGSDFYL